jgi:hypothetical protein
LTTLSEPIKPLEELRRATPSKLLEKLRG